MALDGPRQGLTISGGPDSGGAVRESITVIIPTLNEEECIERCIRSALWADCVLVVDSFSTDRTVEIAQSLTPRVLLHKFEGYAAQKNWAIDQCDTDWIMVLDADEVVSEELQQRILKVLSGAEGHDGYTIKRKSEFLGRMMKHCGWQKDFVLRLWKRGQGRYGERLVHESVDLEGSLGKIHEPIYHYTYRDLDDCLTKFDKYATLAATQMHRECRRASVSSILLRPIWQFLKMYILQHGFLDGRHGMLLSLLNAHYVFLKYARLWQMKRESAHSTGK